MFHPRPFGGIVNILSKSSKDELASKNEKQPSTVTDATGMPHDGSALGNEGFLSHHRRPLPGEEGTHGGYKNYEGKRAPDDSMSGLHGYSNVSTKTAASPRIPVIEIPKDAAQIATSQCIFEKLYLVQLMFAYENLDKENRSILGDMEAPKFKFVDVVPHVHQPAGNRDHGHGSREGGSGLYMHGGHSAFDHGDTGRKAMDLAHGQRRNYFDQRAQKGKDGFRHSREGFDASDYAKRGDQYDSNLHHSDEHVRRKTFEDLNQRMDYRFGHDRGKSHEGPVRQEDENTLQLRAVDQRKQAVAAFNPTVKQHVAHPESEFVLQGSMHAQQQGDRVESRESYRQIETMQQRRHDSMLPLSGERSALQRPMAEPRLTEADVMNTTFAQKAAAEERLMRYNLLTGAMDKSNQPWARNSENFPWQTPRGNRFDSVAVKPDGVFNSPAVKTVGANQSFLERLLDKSFDAGEIGVDEAVLDASNQFQRSLQFAPEGSQVPPTINLEWQYKDPHGMVHGPFSSSQMYTWYINNFFNPNLQMRYNQKMPWAPFKDLYPPNSNPFRENPAGFGVKTPKNKPVHKIVETTNVVVTTVSAVKGADPKPTGDNTQDDESPIFNPRWNKPDEVKVDSLSEIMEKQKSQSITTKAASTHKVAPTAKPSPGWHFAEAEAVSVASEEFPTLALGAEKTSRPKKKPSGTLQQQHNTMPLKVFMKQHAQTPDSTKYQPRESFASKVMGNKH
ncbi:hypothetical protein X943_001548 [Babesia divergens]|uniref:GYF domain-containing protein n=1 Tax=Babesia divergens TaxID=32595 RepID=A0AAD9GFE7_BABDI|nr:hypothetical protein X943_001548 [Babesia divergens]